MSRTLPVALALLALSACSGQAPAAAPTVTVTASPSATSTPSATTPKPSATTPKATPTAPKLGTVAKFDGFSIQVIDAKPVPKGSREVPAFGALVKMCAQVGEISTWWDPWAVVDPDGGQFPSSPSKYESDPKPVYPDDPDKAVGAGKCVKGWIVFEINKGTNITEVRYRNSVGDAAEWAVS